MKNNLDMILHGSIFKMVCNLSLPNFVGVSSMPLLIIADAYFISQLGNIPLASLALVFPFISLMQMMSAGAIGGGTTSSVSRYLGSGSISKANSAVWHAIIIGIILSLIYTIIFCVFPKDVFQLMGGNDLVLQGAIAYSQIAFGGSIFIWLLFILSAMLRAVGDVVTPARVQVIGCIFQIFLAGTLTLGWFDFPSLGIIGPAIAMVVSHFVMTLYLYFYIKFKQSIITIFPHQINIISILDIMKVVVVGSGPAGLSCAHRLALHGYDVDVMESSEKAGGLNEFGIATYKSVDDFAAREVEWLVKIGGITLKVGKQLGVDFSIDELLSSYDAVFIGCGLSDTNKLNFESDLSKSTEDAVDFISDLRQVDDFSSMPIGRNIIVIGGGMTAIDAAVQSRLLGAETVTIVYRRGLDAMGASSKERDNATSKGVKIICNAMPIDLQSKEGLSELTMAYSETDPKDGKLRKLDQTFTLQADQIFCAIGQKLSAMETTFKANRGKIEVGLDLFKLPKLYKKYFMSVSTTAKFKCSNDMSVAFDVFIEDENGKRLPKVEQKITF